MSGFLPDERTLTTTTGWPQPWKESFPVLFEGEQRKYPVIITATARAVVISPWQTTGGCTWGLQMPWLMSGPATVGLTWQNTATPAAIPIYTQSLACVSILFANLRA